MPSPRDLLGVLLVGLLAACSTGVPADECGDGETTGDEECDDGNRLAGDACSPTCRDTTGDVCGNSVVEVSSEQCDDGNTEPDDGCDATCQNEGFCGDGMVEGGEECDDGNAAASDGCDAGCGVEAGYTCTGEPSDCIAPAGTCDDPFLLTLVDMAGTLVGTGSGDTGDATNQVAGADCDGFTSGDGPDELWQFSLSEARDVTIRIEASTVFDATLRLLASGCDPASELAERIGGDGCADDGVELDGEELGYAALPPGTYTIVVDGYDDGQAGTYDLTVTATASTCGDGRLDPLEVCDDGGTVVSDGCNERCDVELGYACDGEPSACVSACGNGALNVGEECDDDNTVDGDRCSATCVLEADVLEVEPNDTTAQVLTATNHLVRGALDAGEVDLYTFTLTAAALVEIETYDLMDPEDGYEGVGPVASLDCTTDTELWLFDAAGDVTMNATALATDDEDGDDSCSYLGGEDSSGSASQGSLAAGTYTIKVAHFDGAAATRYVLDLRISSNVPVAPVAGDLVLNEFLAGDNSSDSNCDGQTTGSKDEFIELVNVSSKLLDLTGVTLADTVVTRHVMASGATSQLAPGQALVVWGGGAPACEGVTRWAIATTGQLGLNDAGDTITIADAAGAPLLVHTYPAVALNVSSNLSPDVVGNAFALHTAVAGAVGPWSPGRRADGSAF